MNPQDSWIQTASGKAVSLIDPRPEDILVFDVAYALAHINRFTGHATPPYSVAEHSVRVASFMYRKIGIREPHLLGAGLFHDAHEAYLGDINTPLKRLLGPTIRALELKLNAAIGAAFDIRPALFKHPTVKHADTVLLVQERNSLMTTPPKSWGPEFDIEVERVEIDPLSDDDAFALFMAVGHGLTAHVCAGESLDRIPWL